MPVAHASLGRSIGASAEQVVPAERLDQADFAIQKLPNVFPFYRHNSFQPPAELHRWAFSALAKVRHSHKSSEDADAPFAPIRIRFHRRVVISMFDNWPIDIKEDLRIFCQDGDADRDYRMVYSFSLDALTPISLDEIERLRQAGVQDIDELPE